MADSSQQPQVAKGFSPQLQTSLIIALFVILFVVLGLMAAMYSTLKHLEAILSGTLSIQSASSLEVHSYLRDCSTSTTQCVVF